MSSTCPLDQISSKDPISLEPCTLFKLRLVMKGGDWVTVNCPIGSGNRLRCPHLPVHPLLKATLTGLRRTYLRFLVFRPKLGETKRFPPFLDHMNGKFFLGGSRFRSGKIGQKLAVGGHRSQCPAELSFIFNRCPAGNPLFLTDNIYF